MPHVELLLPSHHRRLPWKNGRGELVLIDGEGGPGWQNNGVAWHFGRTAIVEEGPFSDYTGYERLQVVIDGRGLVLVTPDREIDLRAPMRPRRYDGGTPIRTRLENGPVAVVNLIADRARFTIDLQVADPGSAIDCAPGHHVVYAPAVASSVRVNGQTNDLPQDHALRLRLNTPARVEVVGGHVLIGSILPKT